MSTLERNGSSTLRISITSRAEEPNPAPSALRLLWEQSERWGEFVFFGTTSSLPDFSVLYGKFSQLHHLHFTVSDLPRTVLDAFQVTPRLETLAAEISSQNVAAFSRLQLKQIEHLTILEYADTPTPFFVTAVHRLSKSTTRLAVIFMTPLHQDEMEQSTSPVVSNINILNVWAGGVTLPGTQSALDIVIDNLTLPHLAHLCLYSNTHDTVPWPHSRFISLATRSAFAAHLLTLNIQTFLISEAELLQVLAALPMLNHLLVADHPAPDLVQGAGTVHAASAPLITTSLLAALVRRPDSASASSSSSSIPGAHGETLVPQLITLTFNSVLKFDDWVLLAFLLSRAHGTPFVLDLGYPPVADGCWIPPSPHAYTSSAAKGTSSSYFPRSFWAGMRVSVS
ncbi:hypothetical protein C8R43DRAFT_1243301 [Mycena crocata]|nr:hypothetical protein C8R43DRAFT_1243301 [Mycena crocata]